MNDFTGISDNKDSLCDGESIKDTSSLHHLHITEATQLQSGHSPAAHQRYVLFI